MKTLISNIKNRYSLLQSSLDIQQASDYQEIMNSANLLLDNTFIFNRTWDMEKDHLPLKINNLDFLTQHKIDPEFNFMLNRFEYLYNLFCAYKATNNINYLLKAKELILARIGQDNFETVNIANRELDAAMRMLCFLDGLTIFLQDDCISQLEVEIIFNHLKIYPDFIYDHFKEKFELVNWGSIQTQSLLILLPYIDQNYQQNSIYKWAKNMLEKQLALAVNDDGLLYEQSTMYHIDVLLYGLRLIQENKEFTYLKPIYYKMAQALYHLASCDGLIDAYGDSDFCHIHDCLLIASNIFDDPNLLNKNPVNCFSSYNLIYNNNLKLYKNKPPFKTCYYDFIDSGINSITSNQASFWFYNGGMGSGHAHAKNLSISYFNTKPIIASCGRYTYVEGNDRNNFRSELYHNGIMIDNQEVCQIKDAWSYQYFGNPNKNYVKHLNNHHYIEGSFYDEGNKFLKRGIFSINNNELIVIIDEVLMANKHFFQENFNLYHQVKPTYINDYSYQLDTDIFILSPEKINLEPSEISPQYNLKFASQRLVIQKKFLNHGHNIIAIGNILKWQKLDIYQNNNILDDQFGIAYEITTLNNDKYSIITLFNEIYHGAKVLKCQDYSFHAKRIIIDHQLNKLFIMRT